MKIYSPLDELPTDVIFSPLHTCAEKKKERKKEHFSSVNHKHDEYVSFQRVESGTYRAFMP